jgi:catechol 2,3-dioxygenase-like lactoylglutathione lyase family enzyme
MSQVSLAALLVLATATIVSAQQPESHTAPAAPPLVASRIIFRVTNLAKSVAFYRDLVGLPLQSDTGEFAVLGAGGALVMLHQLTLKSSAPSTGLAAFTEVVLESPDILASYRALKARGVAFRIEPRVATTDGTRDLYVADFRDPDGHVLSISGWVAHPAR